jgi:hypothetical protein
VVALPWEPMLPIPRGLYQFSPAAFAAPDPAAWCHDEAVRLLGPKARRKDVQRLAICLAGHLDMFRPHMPLLAAALFFSPGFKQLPAGVMTRAEVFDVASLNEGRQFTRADAATAAADVRAAPPGEGEQRFGQVEAVDRDLPAGPALRVHRYVMPAGQQRGAAAGETIVWTIWPPGPPFALVLTSLWTQPYYGQVAAEITDHMAQEFRVRSIDSGPGPGTAGQGTSEGESR